MDNFFSRVTLKFDGWPWKILGYLFYATSSYVHHFVAIGEFNLKLQSGNAQFGSKWTIFFSCVTLQCDGWPWKIIGHLFYATSSFVHHFVIIGEFKLELQSGNAPSGSNLTLFGAVWPWNLTDDLEQGKSDGFDSCDRPSNLAQIWSNSSIFQPVWPWNLMYDLEK